MLIVEKDNERKTRQRRNGQLLRRNRHSVIHRTRCIILALCYLSTPLFSWGAEEKAPQSQWLVGASDLTANNPVTVWLAVQPMASAKSVTVTVGTPHDTTITVSQAGNATCSTILNNRIRCVTLATDYPLLLEYTVTAYSAGTMRMLALVEYTRSDGSQSGYATLSDRMVVRGVLEVGPTAVAIISALFGLIAGMLTQWFVSWRQEKQDDRKRQLDEQAAARKAQQEVERKLLTGLSVELVKNRAMIEDYLEGHIAAPTLSVGSYNTLSKSAQAYLNTASRTVFLQKTDVLYKSIHKYNIEVAKKAEDQVIHSAAAVLLETLKKTLEE